MFQKRHDGMSKKRHLWLRLGIASILLGVLLAMFEPTLLGSFELSDYQWQNVIIRCLIFVPVWFLALGLLVLLFRLLCRS